MEYYGKNTISVGPWGGQNGLHWDDGVYFTIRQLELGYGAGIDSIRIEYDRNGTSVWSEKHGGNGGARVDKVRLDHPDEFLTSIHGYYGSLQEWGPVVIRSLTFQSNKSTYGPYGVEEGAYFSFPTTQGKIVGFHGKCGWFLDAIGVHLEPIYKINPPNFVVHPQPCVLQGMVKYEYSMIQGSLSKNYDPIVAPWKKDNYGNPITDNLSRQYGYCTPDNLWMQYSESTPDNLLRQNNESTPDNLSRKTSTSRELSHTESKNKIAEIAPPTIERVPSKTAQGVVTYGPWGGRGGVVFDDGIYDGIMEIHLTRNVAIVSVRVCYDLHGQPEWGSKNGGSGGFKTEKIVFNYPAEILTHITGYYGPAIGMGPNVIKSLTFHTTKRKHGPYGEEQGQPFSTKLREGVVVGIHGRKGLFIDAIGVHVLEGKATPASSPLSKPIIQKGLPANDVDNQQWSFKLGKKGLVEEAVQRIVKDPAPYGPGPWGGEGGKPWDDGVFTGIKQIILTRADGICSIEIEYDRQGQSVWSVTHGRKNGQSTNSVKLEYPDEVLTCISGYYGPLKLDQGAKVIKSLTFYTSRRKWGPFGEELGSFFTSATTEGKVVGFHGRSGMFLDAIGVHMQHWLGNYRSSKSSYLKKIFY